MTSALPTPAPRIRRFEHMAYGMFIHWGLYSLLGRGEWVLHNEKLDPETYRALASRFTASRFDPDAIARMAKASGMRYIVLTARHHDGFSLYDTRGLSDYDAPHSAAGRDLIAEFVDACRRHDILPFFYHTTLDWDHPAFREDWSAYLDYLHDSVKVLCTAYGPIGGLWFDGNWSRPDADWKLDRLYGMIREHQPEAMIVNNTGLSARGEISHPEIDAVTFEQDYPAPMDRRGMSKYITAEMCYTMNNHWGYGEHDLNYKSPATLIEALAACRKVGANLLLNVGPTGEGEIPLPQQAILQQLGAWIDLFGDAVYEAAPCGARGPGKDFALSDGRDYYFYIHDLPIRGNEHVTTAGGSFGTRAFYGITHPIRELTWMDSGESLDYVADPAKGLLALDATGFPYGTQTVVRVARARIADHE